MLGAVRAADAERDGAGAEIVFHLAKPTMHAVSRAWLLEQQ